MRILKSLVAAIALCCWFMSLATVYAAGRLLNFSDNTEWIGKQNQVERAYEILGVAIFINLASGMCLGALAYQFVAGSAHTPASQKVLKPKPFWTDNRWLAGYVRNGIPYKLRRSTRIKLWWQAVRNYFYKPRFT
jgi:hypothetical protein